MSSSKRHFTAVIGKKEQGTYTSSSPSSAARKAVSKLCADDKNRKVEFYMRETTQGSEKKVYGMYVGYMEKLKKPIELKGRVIRYKPVAKLLKNKKMRGGGKKFTFISWNSDSPDIDRLKSELKNKLEKLTKNYSSKKLHISKFGIQIPKDYPNFEKIIEEIEKTLHDLKINIEKRDDEVFTIHHFLFDTKDKNNKQLEDIKKNLEIIFSKGNKKTFYTHLGFNANNPNRTYKNVPPYKSFFIAKDEIQIAEDFPDFENIRVRIIKALEDLNINYKEELDT
jgi:Holliday junction resolvase RusA-like endonuclease